MVDFGGLVKIVRKEVECGDSRRLSRGIVNGMAGLASRCQ